MKFLLPLFVCGVAFAQQPSPAPTPPENSYAPSWETQRQARTYLLSIPAPRGQITDRNGEPLAQTRVSYNLAINFPTPLDFSERRVLAFAHDQIAVAQQMLKEPIAISDDQILKHYSNRGILPLDIAQDLAPAEVDAINKNPHDSLSLHPIYVRFYPNGTLAGHVLGYAGKTGRTPMSPVQNNDLLWPGSEGREGIEQTFNEQLNGKVGQLNIALDATGKKVSEKVAIPPQPGYNVVTTIDENLQRLAEDVLAKSGSKGALVVLDPNNGDVLAMASWPVFNPNAFVPSISAEAFKALQDNPAIPLLPRAFRSAYPPGSTFKVAVGVAALESGAIKLNDEFDCPAAMEIGNRTFKNWKKEGTGMLNFAQALTQSCDTYFYQIGIKTGAQPIVDWATKMGFGVKTGIPLIGEVDGRVPTNEYMKKVYGRRIMDGDLANLAIGQGDLLVTPLQMAQAMGAIGNGGTLYQTRLVKQVQTIDNQIVTAYDVRAKNQLELHPQVLTELKNAMVDVVSSASGTAGRAGVDNVKVAGKTGTAQWGPKNNERTAAWFAGFAPADQPKYAFAALYEGKAGNDEVHGGNTAAPMIGKVLNEVFKDQTAIAKKSRKKKSQEE
ncbi:MAG: penicillin-binding protein 2 [Verrucomicrobiota bacterium]|nr:penicillin-binding protein 2 [Verrucomicrobiota bacterium]